MNNLTMRLFLDTDRFYGNVVRMRKVAHTDHCRAYELETRWGLGMSCSGSVPIVDAISLQGNLFTVMSEGSPVWDVDLSTFFVPGWDARVEQLDHGGRRFGVVFFDPESEDEALKVRKMTSDDLNPCYDKPCDSFTRDPLGTCTAHCQRPKGHWGEHQAVLDSPDAPIYHHWSSDGGGSDWAAPFGFLRPCQHCQELVAASSDGPVSCFSCSFWMEKVDMLDRSFRINGEHYLPGQGGFYGHVFTLRRMDGSKWSGQLWHQGTIPPHFRDLFPDNAVIIE